MSERAERERAGRDVACQELRQALTERSRLEAALAMEEQVVLVGWEGGGRSSVQASVCIAY